MKDGYWIQEGAPEMHLGDVLYVTAIGDGHAVTDPLMPCPYPEPPYVWVCVDEPTYSAPPHVTRALNARFWEAWEAGQDPRVVGWYT